MHKYGFPIRIALVLAVWFFIVEVQAIPSIGEIDSSYCVVPVLGDNGKYKGSIDFFKTYPIPPHVLISDRFGSLWTIKGFNESYVYTPEMELSHFDDSIYSLEQGAVYAFNPYALEKGNGYHQKIYKFNGYNYPEVVDRDEILKLGSIENIRKDQHQKYKGVAILGGDLYAAARDSELYLIYSSGKTRRILGGQLVRPLSIELYEMAGRGDVLVNTYNGLFILAENTELNSSYCRQVTPTKNHNFKLTPLLTNIQDDVIFGALKTGENKYLIYMQSDKYWIYDHGKVEQTKEISGSLEIISSKDVQSGNIIENSITVRPQRVFLKDKFYRFFVRGEKGVSFYGDIITEIPHVNSYLLQGGVPQKLDSLAIRDSNLGVTVLSSPSPSEIRVSPEAKANLRYLFDNGFFTIVENSIRIKKFPHIDSWQSGWIDHIHPDKNNPHNTIMFEGSRGGAYKINMYGALEKFNSFPISDTENINLYFSDNETLYFLYQNKVMEWRELEGVRELAELDKSKHGEPILLTLLDGKLIVAGSKGAFKINKNGEITTYIADLYTIGSIKKIEPIPNHQAYLVSGTYGLFIVDKNEVVSRLYLDGRINEYFHGKLVYDGIESYINTSDAIYRIDSVDSQ